MGEVAPGQNQEVLTLRHIAKTLSQMRRRYIRDGRPWDLEFESIRLLAANGGQSRPQFDDQADASNSLCMTYSAAARRLSISERSLRRLVASGGLPTVSVGGSIRITEADLQAYASGLDRRRSA